MSQNKQVIILVSDDNYVNHVKSVINNCIEQGNYTGEFAVICPVNSDAAATFKGYGFNVLEVESNGFLQKFSVFDKYFKQWDEVLYLDCDIVVLDDLQRLFDLLKRDDKVIWCDTEDCTTLESMWRDTKKHEHPEVYEYIKTEYPHINKQTFNSAFLLFKPSIIGDNVPQQLMDIQDKVELANRQSEGGTDQQILNMLLWNNMKKIPDKLVCFWGLAEPENDVDSEYRQFKKGDKAVAIHFSRWYSQWIEKTPDAGGYLNRVLNIPHYDLYNNNLNKFNERFS